MFGTQCLNLLTNLTSQHWLEVLDGKIGSKAPIPCLGRKYDRHKGFNIIPTGVPMYCIMISFLVCIFHFLCIEGCADPLLRRHYVCILGNKVTVGLHGVFSVMLSLPQLSEKEQLIYPVHPFCFPQACLEKGQLIQWPAGSF